jgi:methylated-DNA-protein-cysteine methyltransferase-like protein
MRRLDEADPDRLSTYARIYDVVRRIPPGRVATYGQVAELAGMRGHARLVGYALHSLPDGHTVPWHRVINARGRISLRTGEGDWGDYQRHLLEREGVRFDSEGRVSLTTYRWTPEDGALLTRGVGQTQGTTRDHMKPGALDRS